MKHKHMHHEHGHHMKHEGYGHMAGPRMHFNQSMPEQSSHGMYRNEVEMPEVAAMAHPGMGQGDKPDMGCCDFKGEADPIAYGQAQGHMKEDQNRIHSQFKDYHWD
jgi:hypothetical protein